MVATNVNEVLTLQIAGANEAQRNLHPSEFALLGLKWLATDSMHFGYLSLLFAYSHI